MGGVTRCTKTAYKNIDKAYAAVRRIDPTMHVYICDEHAALHVGHPSPPWQPFATWKGALRAAMKYVDAYSNPVSRIRVRVFYRPGKGWYVRRTDDAPARIPGLERQPASRGPLDGVRFRVVGGV